VYPHTRVLSSDEEVGHIDTSRTNVPYHSALSYLPVR
jgi:hypothetical protein